MVVGTTPGISPAYQLHIIGNNMPVCRAPEGIDSGAETMITAFEQGSGICVSSINFIIYTIIILSVIAVVVWYIIGQYFKFTENMSTAFELKIGILASLSFMGIITTLFMI